MRTYGFECKLLVQLFNRTYTKLCKETAGKSIAQHVAKGSHPKPGKARRVRTNWKAKFHLPSFGRSLSCEPADVLPFAEAAYHNSSESLLLSRMAIWCRHLHVDSSRSKHEMNWNEIKLSLSFTRCASPWIPLLSTLIIDRHHPDCNFESGSLTSSHRHIVSRQFGDGSGGFTKDCSQNLLRRFRAVQVTDHQLGNFHRQPNNGIPWSKIWSWNGKNIVKLATSWEKNCWNTNCWIPKY